MTRPHVTEAGIKRAAMIERLFWAESQIRDALKTRGHVRQVLNQLDREFLGLSAGDGVYVRDSEAPYGLTPAVFLCLYRDVSLETRRADLKFDVRFLDGRRVRGLSADRIVRGEIREAAE